MRTLAATNNTNFEGENTKSSNNKNNAFQHKGHVCLFIRDVTSSSIETNNNNNNNKADIFMTKKGIVYQRVRLNGILVSQSNEKMYIWLDDGTDSICVILSPRLLARMDAPKLISSASVTVFGLVKHLNNEFVIQCGGFHVERDIADELYHHIKVVSNQPLSLPSAVVENTTTNNHTASSAGDDNKENNTKHPQKPAVLFQSLSSQPSPPLKHSFEANIATPEKKNQTTPMSTPLHFAWSPEQPIATSTPLNKGFRLFKDSNLKLHINNNMDQSLIDDEDDDSFGDMNLSYTRIEAEAIQTKPQKRKWEA